VATPARTVTGRVGRKPTFFRNRRQSPSLRYPRPRPPLICVLFCLLPLLTPPARSPNRSRRDAFRSLGSAHRLAACTGGLILTGVRRVGWPAPASTPSPTHRRRQPLASARPHRAFRPTIDRASTLAEALVVSVRSRTVDAWASERRVPDRHLSDPSRGGGRWDIEIARHSRQIGSRHRTQHAVLADVSVMVPYRIGMGCSTAQPSSVYSSGGAPSIRPARERPMKPRSARVRAREVSSTTGPVRLSGEWRLRLRGKKRGSP
jgi:hypothetical protein